MQSIRPKKGARTDIANYRPISLLCIPSKLLEHQVCNIIDEHLSNSSLKSSSQWGFTKGLSSEGMLLKMTDTWKMNMDKGMIVGAIFVDFKKAFDSISHNILSLKLQATGLSGNLHEWLMDYLNNRFQYTVVNGHPSNLDEVKYDVPQGSLFILSTSMTSLMLLHLEMCSCMQTIQHYIVWGRTLIKFAHN